MGNLASRVGKFVGIISALFVASLALTPPATEYEISIFDGLSLLTLSLGVILITFGVVLLTATVVTDHSYLSTGAGSVLLSYAGLYAVPHIRGYAFYGTLGYDMYLHYGRVIDIIASGSLPDTRYPATHLMISELTLITGLAPEGVSTILSYGMFIGTIYFTTLIAWTITRNQTLTICVLIAALPFTISSHRLVGQPWVLGLMFIPLLLVCVYQRDQSNISSYKWSLITLVLLFALTIYHPLSMITGLLVVIGYVLTLAILEARNIRLQLQTALRSRGVMIVGVGSLTLVTWVVLSGGVDGHIQRMVIRLIESNPGGAQHAGDATGGQFTMEQIFWYFLLPELGTEVAVLLMSGLAFLFIVGRLFAGYGLSAFEWITVVIITIAGVYTVTHLAVEVYATGIVRNSHMVLLMAPVILGIGLYYALNWGEKLPFPQREAIISIVIVVMIGVILLGGATAYNTNSHLTVAETDGHGWLLDHKNLEMPITGDRTGDNYAWYHYGYTNAQQIRVGNYIAISEPLPHRLGYADSSSVGESIIDGYLVTRQSEQIGYANEPEWRLKQIEYYTEGDVSRLRDDPNAEQVYTNSDYSVWIIDG